MSSGQQMAKTAPFSLFGHSPWALATLFLLVSAGGASNGAEAGKSAGAAGEAAPEKYSKTPLAGVRKADTPEKMFPTYRAWRKSWQPFKHLTGFYVPTCVLPDGKKYDYLAWIPDSYDPGKSWPMVVILHGGGSGPGYDWAASYMAPFTQFHGKQSYIYIAPPAPANRNWWLPPEDIEAAFAAIKDAARRFHVDRRRMYLYGHSMGAVGAMNFARAVPGLFAAYAINTQVAPSRVAPPPSFAGAGLLLLNSGGERKKKALEAMGAKVELHAIKTDPRTGKKVGHRAPHYLTLPLMFAFFETYRNKTVPDLEAARLKVRKAFAAVTNPKGRSKPSKKEK